MVENEEIPIMRCGKILAAGSVAWLPASADRFAVPGASLVAAPAEAAE
jgi:hypothetical protein